jgi:peptide-methionine (R)-S-oxide reductase
MTGFSKGGRSEDEWRQVLDGDRCRVLFQEGTEPPFSSPLNEEKRAGTFICAACHQPLFSSDGKYDSGTGWPSFFQPIDPARIETRRDFRLLLPRTEYHCARCGGHQGHVFGDGPAPTRQRYCNNGLALLFIPEGEPLPELR